MSCISASLADAAGLAAASPHPPLPTAIDFSQRTCELELEVGALTASLASQSLISTLKFSMCGKSAITEQRSGASSLPEMQVRSHAAVENIVAQLMLFALTIHSTCLISRLRLMLPRLMYRMKRKKPAGVNKHKPQPAVLPIRLKHSKIAQQVSPSGSGKGGERTRIVPNCGIGLYNAVCCSAQGVCCGLQPSAGAAAAADARCRAAHQHHAALLCKVRGSCVCNAQPLRFAVEVLAAAARAIAAGARPLHSTASGITHQPHLARVPALVTSRVQAQYSQDTSFRQRLSSFCSQSNYAWCVTLCSSGLTANALYFR
jgi:hypothetical protein